MNCACYQARRFPSRRAMCESCLWAPSWRWAYVDQRAVLRARRLRRAIWFLLDAHPARRQLSAQQRARRAGCVPDGVVATGSDFVEGRVPLTAWPRVLAQLEAVVAPAPPPPTPALQIVEGVHDG